MDAKRVKELQKELDNAGSSGRLVEVLTEFKRDFKPTEQLLRETKIGVAVNRLRGHADPEVSTLVKKLVSSWRETVQQQKSKQQKKKDGAKSGSSAAGAAAGANKEAASTAKGTTAKGGAAGAAGAGSGTGAKSGARDWKSDGVNTQVYSEPVRNSCIQVTYNALVIDSSEPASRVLGAAKDVELAVFTHEKGTTATYRNKMRSLFINLKDPKNPQLRRQVVAGTISGERLRTMTPQEMANDELKTQMEAMEKQNLFNAQSAQEQRATTDRFTCGKCKQKKVSYYQMQTRSADEPLTTFCTCENCGNRWKFS